MKKILIVIALFLLKPAVYGQASGFLRHAQGDYGVLREYVAAQIRGLELAGTFLKIK